MFTITLITELNADNFDDFGKNVLCSTLFLLYNSRFVDDHIFSMKYLQHVISTLIYFHVSAFIVQI